MTSIVLDQFLIPLHIYRLIIEPPILLVKKGTLVGVTFLIWQRGESKYPFGLSIPDNAGLFLSDVLTVLESSSKASVIRVGAVTVWNLLAQFYCVIKHRLFVLSPQ